MLTRATTPHTRPLMPNDALDLAQQIGAMAQVERLQQAIERNQCSYPDITDAEIFRLLDRGRSRRLFAQLIGVVGCVFVGVVLLCQWAGVDRYLTMMPLTILTTITVTIILALVFGSRVLTPVDLRETRLANWSDVLPVGVMCRIAEAQAAGITQISIWTLEYRRDPVVTGHTPHGRRVKIAAWE